MTKPSLTQKPPELKDEVKPINKEKAIPLPKTIEPVKKRPEVKPAKNAKPVPDSNVIPTRGEAGSGGAGGRSGGAGGGFGGGHGVSIGIGSGGPSGFGDSLYARQIEDRIGQNWQKPAPGARFEITYSFFVEADGRISEIQKEKSSGNQFYDIAAESAIRSCNPFNPPNGQYRGMRLKFVAKFVYPPN
jgi:TonB family protein